VSDANDERRRLEAKRRKMRESYAECERRIGQLTGMIATMDTERAKLIVESTILRTLLAAEQP
jgi:hypothetical protein